jgi:site-specific DNA-methyltransferase (adenine-specific)
MAVSPFTIASGQVPDVLATLAQLPNDEVFTPPTLVNAMLDVLPEEVWSNHTYRWLDPATKSGVFLRESYKRLMIGLAKWEPDSSLRREHILKNMLFGAAITSLASELSRRSVYQTTDATGLSIKDESIKDLIVHFDSTEGNILYAQTEHTISKGKCTICRAPEKLLRDRRESFAYSFIHGSYPTKEMQDMKFDVVVGNPPYQLGTEGHGATASAIYHLFVQRAVKMNPRYVLMITPSRWFAGGKGLSEFRTQMLKDRHLRAIVDYPDGRECFPSVKVEGGISYFLWDSNWDSDCKFSTVVGGKVVSTAVRDLGAGQGVLVRDNRALTILEKVKAVTHQSIDELCTVTKPFGLTMRSNYPGSVPEPFEGAIPLIYGNRIGYSRPDQIQRNHHWISKYKVILPMAYGAGSSSEQHAIYGEPIALAPGSACTQTYFIVGMFDTPGETENYAKYLTSKFVRFLVSLRKITQHVTPDRFAFVPKLDFGQDWSDSTLYEMFGLTDDEIAYIEKAIGPRDWINSLDSPIPVTHLPGGRKHRAGDVQADADDEEDE